MAKRLVLKGVTVVRDGARVRPTIGEQFDFTKEELEGLDGSGHLSAVKGDSEDEGTKATSTKKPSNAQASQSKAKNGKKVATANKADDEKTADEVAEEADGDQDDDL